MGFLKTGCKVVDYIQLIQDRMQWGGGGFLVKTVLNLALHEKRGSFLTSWATISFSREILHHVIRHHCVFQRWDEINLFLGPVSLQWMIPQIHNGLQPPLSSVAMTNAPKMNCQNTRCTNEPDCTNWYQYSLNKHKSNKLCFTAAADSTENWWFI
jgi:hypothetical protein